MPDKRAARRAKQARRDTRRAQARARAEAEESPLVEEVRDALASGHPFDLLFLVSVIIEATAGHSEILAEPGDPQPVGLDNLIASFVDVDEPETTVLLAVLGELVDDDLLRIRCRNEVAVRGGELPQWIADLSRTTLDRAYRMTHVLGDGDELLLSVRLPQGYTMTGAVFINHQMMSEIGDAFFVPETVDTVLDLARRSQTDPDTTFVEMSLADIRAWVEHGMDIHDVIVSATESDTWPASRPLLAWLIRGLPEGGATYQAPDLSPTALGELLDEFFGTTQAIDFADLDHRELLEVCIDDGTGDPLRWSESRLRRLLIMYAPMDDDVSMEALLDLPQMLRAYVPFAHAHADIRAELTADALAAIDDTEQQYRQMVLDYGDDTADEDF